ncbi:hypothetical protein OG194_00435 [Streptomyces sp. NBC_01288]|uniref:hypothetical protein n=1 Tax=Streptomyces sp. NBC_01288 TaxID=2903814 RepID=UPI002E136CC3|nr:hypothetical protein OG194_00435 [Streptomyces sp. NBC_01288]
MLSTELATWIRGHWGIENLLHHVQGCTFREDDSKVRSGTLPAPSPSPGTAHRRPTVQRG